MCQEKIIFLLLISFGLPVVKPDSGWAFVNPQTNCKLDCQNGGVCAYSIENPRKHKCICFIGMYEGELCELHVTTTSASPDITISDPDIIINEPSSTSSEKSIPYDTEFEASPEETVYDPTEGLNEAGSEYWEHSPTNRQLNDEQYLTAHNPYHDDETKHYSNRELNKENLLEEEEKKEEEEDGWMMVKRSKSHNSSPSLQMSMFTFYIILFCPTILYVFLM